MYGVPGIPEFPPLTETIGRRDVDTKPTDKQVPASQAVPTLCSLLTVVPLQLPANEHGSVLDGRGCA